MRSQFRFITILSFTLAAIVYAQSAGNDTNGDDDPFDFDTGFLIRMCTNTTAKAGEPMLVSVKVNKTTATGPESAWNAYRLTLAKGTNATDAVTGPVCTYSDCLPLTSTAVTVAIDPAWGPSGQFYEFSASFFIDSDVNVPSYHRGNESQLVYSSNWYSINMTGMTGRFYDFEATPPASEYGHNWPWGLPIYPCTAYQCARECIDRYFDQSEGYTTSVMDSIKGCADACPGAQNITNNCPAVGGVPAVIANGIDPNFVPDGCKSSEERSSSSSSLAATATETAPSRPTERSKNSGARTIDLQSFGLIPLYILLHLLSGETL